MPQIENFDQLCQRFSQQDIYRVTSSEGVIEAQATCVEGGTKSGEKSRRDPRIIILRVLDHGSTPIAERLRHEIYIEADGMVVASGGREQLEPDKAVEVAGISLAKIKAFYDLNDVARQASQAGE